MAHEPHSMGEVVEGIEELADGKRVVCLGDALDRFGKASFGPVLIVLPLIELSPIGGIPGLPTALAILIALIALQLLFGRDHLWLPGFVERRSLAADKLHKGAEKLEGLATRMDRWFKGRLRWLTRGPALKVAALCVIALCATVPPLELIPFASSAPMLSIAAFGLALTVRDGLMMLMAMALTAAAMVAAAVMLLG